MTKYFFLCVTFLVIFGCSNEGDTTSLVTIEASGLTDDKLALNNSATFTATISGLEGDSSLFSYQWTLLTDRGELSDGFSPLPNPFVGGKTISCIGKTGGEEQIMVEVLDASNNKLASAAYDFDIAPFDGNAISRGCFDQPKIFYQNGTTAYVRNYDGTNEESFSTRSGAYNINISPNGEWVTWTAYDSDFNNPPVGFNLYLRKCDETDAIIIPGEFGQLVNEDANDSSPEFSPDSKTLYFMRPDPNSERLTPSAGGSNPSEIVAYDMETGEQRFLTSLYKENARVRAFTVNPVTGVIAFYRSYYAKDANGINRTTEVRLSFLNPETGSIQDFTTLPLGGYRDMDYAPDGGDIIFSGNAGEGQGIYRINLTDGSQPFMLFPNPVTNRVGPSVPHYYANGTRIVYQRLSKLWTMDANGNDVQLFFDSSRLVFMQGVLY
ncbi:MAG: TolB family protein [Jejuia sp.]